MSNFSMFTKRYEDRESEGSATSSVRYRITRTEREEIRALFNNVRTRGLLPDEAVRLSRMMRQRPEPPVEPEDSWMV